MEQTIPYKIYLEEQEMPKQRLQSMNYRLFFVQNWQSRN